MNSILKRLDFLTDPDDAIRKGLAGRRLLVTGATGFIGRHLIRKCHQLGITPALLARPERAKALSAHFPVVEADLTDAAALRAAVAQARPDVILHLAGFTSPVRDLDVSSQAIACNLGATVALAEAAADLGVSAFVTTGTSEEYGRQEAPFSENLAPAPLSPYSASKAAATLWLQMMHGTHGFPAVILRPFLVYGPGQSPPKLVPTAILRALAGDDFDMTSGIQNRELTFVGDVVDGILLAAVTPAAHGKVLNLGSGDEIQVVEIVRQVYEQVGGAGAPRPGALPDRANDMMRYCADTRLAAAVLGWRARTSLTDGLRQTIDWARSHGDTPIPLVP